MLAAGHQRGHAGLPHLPQLQLQRRVVGLQRRRGVRAAEVRVLAFQRQHQRRLGRVVLHLRAGVAEHLQRVVQPVRHHEAPGQRDRDDDQLARVHRQAAQRPQPVEVVLARVRQRVRGTEDRHLLGGVEVAPAGVQRLPERHLGGLREPGRHGELLVRGVVQVHPFEAQAPADPQPGPVHQVHVDLVRLTALAQRVVRARQHVVRHLVDAQLGQHQCDVLQRRGQQLVPRPLVEHRVGLGFLVEHHRERGRDLGQRLVLGVAQQEPASAQRPRVRLQHDQAVAAAVSEHLVELRVGHVDEPRRHQPDHGRGSEQLRDDAGLTTALRLGEDVVDLGRRVELCGEVAALGHGDKLARAAHQPRVGHLVVAVAHVALLVDRFLGQLRTSQRPRARALQGPCSATRIRTWTI